MGKGRTRARQAGAPEVQSSSIAIAGPISPVDFPEVRSDTPRIMKTLLINLLIALLLIAGARAQSGSQFFVKVAGIDGESTAESHANEIDVFSFKLGVAQKGITDFGGGAGAAKATFLPVMIHKNVDVSSPQLFLACTTGKHIPKVELKAARLMGEILTDYLVITLTDVIISSVNHESADTDGNTTFLESVALNFSKIEISYKKQNISGGLEDAIKAGFDVKANKKL